MMLVHASTVEIAGQGVLIRGPSGSGKSDLALRLIDGGAVLVADDQTALSLQDGRVVARPPDAIAGLLEIRGVGIVSMPHRARVPLALVVDLRDGGDIERLPEPSLAHFLGLAVPRIDIAPFHASAAAKVRLAILSAKRDIMRS